MMSFKQYLKYKEAKEYSRQQVASTLGEPFVSAFEKMHQNNSGTTGAMISLSITGKDKEELEDAIRLQNIKGN
jgi:hypothetical protein